MTDLECSLCTNTLSLGPHMAHATSLTAIAFPIACIEVLGWIVYFTGTAVPTVICDRCAAAHGSASATLRSIVDDVAQKHRSVPA